MVKKVKNSSPYTKLVFSSAILRKDNKISQRKLVGQIKEWRTKTKNIDFVDNSNVIEGHIESKKLHINKRGNSILAKNILKYLRDSYWSNDILNCRMKCDECK